VKADNRNDSNAGHAVRFTDNYDAEFKDGDISATYKSPTRKIPARAHFCPLGSCSVVM
jgi:hypothetical protein